MDNLSLRPEWLVYPKFSIEANKEYDDSKGLNDREFEIHHQIRFDPDDNQIILNMTFRTPEDSESNIPYKVSTELYAVFLISKDFRTLKTKIAKEICNDISSLAFGAIRDFVSTLTARGPWGSYLIPFVDTDDIAGNLFDQFKELDSN